MSLTCPHCHATNVPDGARFCIQCGKVLAAVSAHDQPDRPVTNIHAKVELGDAKVGGSVTGASIGQVVGDVAVHGMATIQFGEKAAIEMAKEFRAGAEAGTAAGLAGGQLPENIAAIRKNNEELLEHFKASDRAGQQATGIESGGIRISRVEVLLKTAMLRFTDAEGLALEHQQKSRKRLNLRDGEYDAARLMQGFDYKAQEVGFREANDLLKQALEIEPFNTSVLLLMAQVLARLTPDDPEDERKVLRQAIGLLRMPNDDVERFRLAQATFMLSTSHDPKDINALREARDIFQQMGRTEWVRKCEELLAAPKSRTTEPDLPAAPDSQQQRGKPGKAERVVPEPRRGSRKATATDVFEPVGSWSIQVMDAFQSTMQLDLMLDGTFAATQDVPSLGMSLQAAGQWAYNPAGQMLQIQGLVGGYQPFLMFVSIQGRQGAGWFGVGSDGISYMFTPGAGH